MHDVDILRLVGGERAADAVLEQRHEAGDHRQRGPQLVRHMREDLLSRLQLLAAVPLEFRV